MWFQKKVQSHFCFHNLLCPGTVGKNLSCADSSHTLEPWPGTVPALTAEASFLAFPKTTARVWFEGLEGQMQPYHKEVTALAIFFMLSYYTIELHVL